MEYINEVLLLGENAIHIYLYSKNLDESWKVSTWKPEEGSDLLLKNTKKLKLSLLALMLEYW